MTLSLPGNSRQAVREAVRNHADAGTRADYLGPRKINDLTKDQLLELADMLGIDVRPIIAAATDGAAIPPAPAVRQDSDRDAGQDATARLNPPMGEEEEEDDDEAPAAPAEDVRKEAETTRRKIAAALMEGDVVTATDTIAALITEARKPPVQIVEYVQVAAPAAGAPAAPLAAPKPSGTRTGAELFNLPGAAASRKFNVYHPGPLTPAVDPGYAFPPDQTLAALGAMARGRNVWLHGPAGTGKSTLPEQLAARTGRPFFLIACDDTTEAPELVGMTVPHDGKVRWQDGVLTAAIRTPNAIILIDEPSVARPGALMVFQSVLASRVLSIKETGETVQVAPGVRFFAADNTNGTGGGQAGGYEGTRRLNRATLDRFSLFLAIDYMPADKEAAVLSTRTGCTAQLARILVDCAGLTRQARVTHAIGLRRLMAWAECLSDGVEPRKALEFAILNSATKDDREQLEQCCALALDRASIAAALNGKATQPQPQSAAARDFD